MTKPNVKLSEARKLAKNRAKQLRYCERQLKEQEAKIKSLEYTSGGNLPTVREAELLGRVAALVAQGKTTREIAKLLSVNRNTIHFTKIRWREYWHMVLSRAKESIIISVRAMAGTDEIFSDPDKYMAMAKSADHWTGQQGTKLFPAADGELTLSKFYKEWYLPNRLSDASPKTLEIYSSTVKQWRLLTGDPPINKITSTTISRFRDALTKMRGRKLWQTMSPNSVRTRLRILQVILDKLGPPGRGNRDALDILPRVPWAKPPREIERIPKTIPLDHLSACIAAAVAMEFPQVPGIKPAAWWRALLIVAWNTGLRIGSLLSMRMSDIDWQNYRLILPASRMKSRRPMIVHLNQPALNALRSIRTDRELVFPWPQVICNRTFYKCLHALEDAAGISKDQHFGFHAIRKTVATVLWGINPGAAQYALGHTTSDVTRKHYVDGGGLVARALDALPQPSAFTGAADGG